MTSQPEYPTVIPNPREFFDTVMRNAVATVNLAVQVDGRGVRLSEADRQLVEAGVAAGITATVDELARRNLLAASQ